MDFYSKAAIQPYIPANLITDDDKKVFAAFNVTLQPEGESFYLFSSDRQTSAELNDVELEEAVLFTTIQGIIRRSNGALPWVSIDESLLCSGKDPDGFGGQAVFLTADALLYTSTAQWLEQQIGAFENGVKMATSQFCGEITVIDPDTSNEIILEVHKDAASGGMFAIDASFADLVSDCIPSPFNEDGNITLGDVPEGWVAPVKNSETAAHVCSCSPAGCGTASAPAAIILEFLSEVEGVVTFSNGIATLEDGTELLIAASLQDGRSAKTPTILNPPAPAAKPILGIIVQGGLVQLVVSNTPDLIDAKVLVIDYDDTDSADQDEILMVRQADGSDTPAVGHVEGISLATIDLETTLSNL
jgi:hypothetical protein